MIRIVKTLKLLLIAALFTAVSCKKEEYGLGSPLNKSDLKFKVVQDLSLDPGGNVVILINETPEVIPMWDYQTGRSIKPVDTVRFVFQGSYTVKFSVLSGGKMIDADPVMVDVKKSNFDYITDPAWIKLTGGANQEKQWLLDTEAKLFPGPITILNPADNSVWWDPGLGAYPDVMKQGNYGSMIFSLKGGAFFTNEKLMEGGVKESGTFAMDVAGKKLTINGATILRDYKPAKNGINGISDWSNYFIYDLTENGLRLGVMRDRDVDGEGLAILVYNFISKEYSDNWVPVETGPDEGFNPKFNPGELLTMLTGGSSSGRLWKLDAAGNPVDWIGKGKGWTTSHASSRDWGWTNDWDAVANNSWIIFDRTNGQRYTRNQNGVITQGPFTINEATNEITLEDNTLIQNTGGGNWMSPNTNKITVVKAFPGKVATKGIWFGTLYTAAKDEWLAFHYVLSN